MKKKQAGIISEYAALFKADEQELAQPPLRLLIMDNYDSFTYNLAQAFALLNCEVSVKRSDQVSVAQLKEEQWDALVISPGPGGPHATGNCRSAYQLLRGRIAILGICLGHQLIAQIHGAKICPAPKPRHGKADPIRHVNSDLFEGVRQDEAAARYHSLVAEELRAILEPLAITTEADGAEVNMAFKVQNESSWGIQFHPESFLSPEGPKILRNFCRFARNLAKERGSSSLEA